MSVTNHDGTIVSAQSRIVWSKRARSAFNAVQSVQSDLESAIPTDGRAEPVRRLIHIWSPRKR